MLPPLTLTGGWTSVNCTCPASTRPCSIGTAVPTVSASRLVQLDLRVVQYNCLSNKGLAAIQLMDRALEQQQVPLAFLQETRSQPESITETSHYWVLSSAAERSGMEGCQIWLHKTRSLTHTLSARWERPSFTIIHAEPRILIVMAEASGLKFCLASAHAPTSAQPDSVIDGWWAHLSACLRKAPSACIPIFGLDANAKFHQDRRCPDTLDSMPKCRNAHKLTEFAVHHHLWLSFQFDSSFTPLVSWISPTGQRRLLDYILAPRQWLASATTEPTPDLTDLHAGVDHLPVLCTFRPKLDVAKLPSARPINWRALETPLGQQVAQFALATAPAVAWDIDATTHVDVLHRHFKSVASRLLPPAPATPRSPIFSNSTLQLVLDRRSIRKSLRHVNRTAARALMALCFGGWRHARGKHSLPRDFWKLERDRVAAVRNCTRWYVAFHQHSRKTWVAITRDKADFFRRMNHDAREAGPAQFAHRLRAILRMGRRFKTPLVLPLLQGRNGTAVGRDEVLSELGHFFADAERATQVRVADMLQDRCEQPLSGCIEATSMPSIVALAAGFAALESHRAAGISTIPADFYKVSPMASAEAYMPVLLKTISRGDAPWQWTGGLLHSIPKPGKSALTPEGWRSILLLEADSKAILKTMRPGIVTALQTARPPSQFGGLPGRPLSLPAAFVRAHLASLRSQGLSGGIVFFDVKSAYYSVIRDCVVSSHANRRDTAYVQSRAQALFADAGQRQRFVTALQGGNLLEMFGADPATVAYFQAHLQRDTDKAFQATSGTAPGSPVADVLFGLIFSQFLHTLHGALVAQGLQAQVAWLDQDGLPARQACPGHPTWADDLAVLFQVDSADKVVPAVRFIATTADAELRQLGLEPNFLPNKSEAMPVFHGKGSKGARRSALHAATPTVAFERGDGGQEAIRLVAEYTHLGTVIRSDMSEVPNIRKRESYMFGECSSPLGLSCSITRSSPRTKRCTCSASVFSRGSSMVPVSGDSQLVMNGRRRKSPCRRLSAAVSRPSQAFLRVVCRTSNAPRF